MYSEDFLEGLYKKLYLIRMFETKCIKLYRQGLIIGYFHPYLGEEAIAVGTCAALNKDDFITSTHRGHGHCIARGGEVKKMAAELLGKITGYCKGMGGSMHIADLSSGNLGANGIVGGGIPLTVGAALGISIRKEKAVAVVFFSDGASGNGVFCESMNMAAAWNLPLIFVLENNQYAVSTPIEESSRETQLYKRADGFGVRSFQVDGNDVLKVYEQIKVAKEICLAGKGPVLVEAKTFRHGGHHVNDPGKYMPKEKLDYYLAHDPVDIGKKYLLESGIVDEQRIRGIEEAIEMELQDAIGFAQSSPEMSLKEFSNFVEYYNG